MNPIPLSPISSFLKPLRCSKILEREPEVPPQNESLVFKSFTTRVVATDALKELDDHQYTNFRNTQTLNENDFRNHNLHQKQRQILGQCRPIVKRKSNNQTFFITLKHVKQRSKVKDLPIHIIECSSDLCFLKQRMKSIANFRQAFNMTQMDLSNELRKKYGADVSQAQISQLEKQNISIALAKILLSKMEPWLDFCRSMGLSHESFVSRPARNNVARLELPKETLDLLECLFKFNPSPNMCHLQALSDVVKVNREYLRGWFYRKRRKMRCSDEQNQDSAAIQQTDLDSWLETLANWKDPRKEGNDSVEMDLAKNHKLAEDRTQII